MSVYEDTKQKELDKRQSELNSINDYYSNRIATEKASIQKEGDRNLARSNTISAITGMMGAPEATTRAGNTTRATAKTEASMEDSLGAEKQQAVNAFYDKVDNLSATLAQNQYASDKEAAAKAQNDAANSALNALNGLAATGISWDALSKADPKTLNDIVAATGQSAFDIQLKYNAALPKPLQVDWKSEKLADGSLLFYATDPSNPQKILTQKVQSDLGPQEEWQNVDGVGYGVTKSNGVITGIRKLTNKNYAPKTTSDPSIESDDRLAIQNDINSARTGGMSLVGGGEQAGNFIDTDKYKQIRENVAVNSPKLLSWFDSTYNPRRVLNPDDPKAKTYFQTTSATNTGQTVTFK
jgi:hypothetical protein